MLDKLLINRLLVLLFFCLFKKGYGRKPQRLVPFLYHEFIQGLYALSPGNHVEVSLEPIIFAPLSFTYVNSMCSTFILRREDAYVIIQSEYPSQSSC